MEIKHGTIKDLTARNELMDFLLSSLGIEDNDIFLKQRASDTICNFLTNLKEDVVVVIETEYVDKYFRDAYYHYFASKLHYTRRNCSRLSFFTPATKIGFSNEDFEKMRINYWGFAVIRPIVASIGRNAISPMAFGSKRDCSNFIQMQSPIHATCMGIKTMVSAFPHSSQDSEVMTCAETTVWTIMEYFGNKYPEYRPLMPSQIDKLVDPHTYNRHLPSSGLTFQQISVLFKEVGFGTVVYDSNLPNLKEVMACYIESGIPLAVCLESNLIGHACVAIGHKDIDASKLDFSKTVIKNGVNLFIWNDHINDFIFNDDNLTPYQIADFNDPAKHYVDNGHHEWSGVKITSIIVPLNKKVYLEAKRAIDISQYLSAKLVHVSDGTIIRTFLASSRTYREYLMLYAGLPDEDKDLYLELEMPKFIWVTELSDKESCIHGKINGMILMDATNFDEDLTTIMIHCQYGGYILKFNKKIGKFEKKFVNLPTEMDRFGSNLYKITN